MHPTATEKLTIHISVMYSAAHAVNTLYNILHDCAAASCPPPPSTADINMQFLSASRCAVFTCRLSHVILQERTLILLHCPSTVNSCTKSTSFHSILTDSLRETAETLFQVSAGKKMLPEDWKRKAWEVWWQRGERNKSDLYHNFPPRPPDDVQWFTTLSPPLSPSL